MIVAILVLSSIDGFYAMRRIRAEREKAKPLWGTASPIADALHLRYKDFEAAQSRACCHAMAIFCAKYDRTTIDICDHGVLLCEVTVNYCPQCGKALEKIKK